MIKWSASVEDCFAKFGSGGDQNSLKNYLNESIDKLTDLIKMV